MKKKRVGGAVLLLCCLFLMTGCNESNVAVSASPEPTQNDSSINIYTVSSENFQVEPLKLKIEQQNEITPKFVVQQVVDNLDEKIYVSKVKVDNDKITVIFEKDKAPLVDVSARMESGILDAISNSLLDNISECNSVYFESSAGAYEGIGIVLEKGEAYASR